MKNKNIVKELIEQLKNQADSDFELHRIEVLERDLFNPPKVEQIDDEHQSFDGVKYYRDSKGHYKNRGYALHQAVYRYFYGDIPPGHDIHHKNLDKADNSPENLEMLTKSEHMYRHSDLKKQFVKCVYCGKSFIKEGLHKSDLHFCSDACRSAYNYRTAENQEIRICAWCGKEFSANKYADAKCCSNSCAQKMRFEIHPQEKHFEDRICPVCGKTFTVECWERQVCCSHKCAAIQMWQVRTRHDNRRTYHCKFCGKPFKTYDDTQKFCSKSCAAKFNNPKQISERNCIICGKKFIADRNSKNKLTCSHHCAGLLAAANRKKNH